MSQFLSRPPARDRRVLDFHERLLLIVLRVECIAEPNRVPSEAHSLNLLTIRDNHDPFLSLLNLHGDPIDRSMKPFTGPVRGPRLSSLEQNAIRRDSGVLRFDGVLELQ